MKRKKRILISVTNKNGLEKFKTLTDLGWEIISTGGTATKLQELGIPCIHIEDITHFPEMMNGRLKTLHPNIFGGILADRSKEEHVKAITDRGIELIDMVVVNLYDFEGKPGIENIDIGGPSLIRAAAKNGFHTVPIVDVNDYDSVIDEIYRHADLNIKIKQKMAIKAFTYTAEYDLAISAWLKAEMSVGSSIWSIGVQ